MRDKQRVSLYLNDDEQAAFNTIKRYYGITSTAAAGRRAIVEHAKQIKEMTKMGKEQSNVR